MNGLFFKTYLCLSALVFSFGCERIAPEDQAFFEQQAKARAEKESMMRRVNDAVTTDDVIDRVREHPVDDTGQTTQEWLNQQIADMKGQMMFPRWTTIRRGSNKQEVTFTFVLNDIRNQMHKLAYTWQVDVLEMTVGPAQFSKLEEITSIDQSRAQQALRRAREHERLLE
jgi:hypothetical protein